MARSEPQVSSWTVVRIVLVAAATLLVLYGVYLIRNVLVLVLVAVFLAVGLDPAVRRLERLGLKRGYAVGAIFLGVVAFLAAFALAVIPPLVEQIGTFAKNLPRYVENVSRTNPRIRDLVAENDIPQKLREAVSDVPALIGGSFGNVVGIAGSVFGAIFSLLTVMILTIYFVLSLSRIREGSLRLVPKSKRAQARTLLDPILEKIGGYIAGQIAVALTAGALAFLFLAIAGVPYPVALALWVAIAALIPLVGATIGAVPAVVVAFATSFGLGLATLVYFIVYQQIENYVIAPRIMTKAVDVSPAAVLLAALIGGTLLGFVGALMAIPAAASIKLIVHEVVLPRSETT
ncbi:MAG TPA: AI-2E family transporter [Actinomycetota bacterium]|jgi:predicted PurR-regulated permease PerM|nr:AI-2E family transporter [Actinomycetota bacterium]